jgi:hypothetical protein
MNCAKELEWAFLTIALVFLSDGYFLAETILKGSIFLILMTLTGIIGRVCAPMFLTQNTAFLNLHFLGNPKFVGICTPMLAFSGGLFSTFLHGLFLGVLVCEAFGDCLARTHDL